MTLTQWWALVCIRFGLGCCSQVWYYPCVDSLPLWVCFELLRPLLRTVPSSTAAEDVLERMHVALELARMSDDETDDDTVTSRTSDVEYGRTARGVESAATPLNSVPASEASRLRAAALEKQVRNAIAA